MQEQNTPDPAQFTRPSARPMGGMPIQRGNYGIPPRQQPAVAPVQPQSVAPAPVAQPAPAGPRSMDIMPPSRPTPIAAAPIPAAQQPVSTPVAPTPATPTVVSPSPQPVAAPTPPQPQTQFVSSLPAQQPLFSNVVGAPATAPEKKHRKLVPLISLVIIAISGLMLVGGAVRLATAGTTSGKKIAAGAVVSNDGNSMTIQFTAEDGKIHKFTSGSNDTYIPGMAVQVAYRSGAPDTTGRDVAPIKSARNLGTAMVVFGILIGGVATVVYFATRTRKPHVKASAIAQPVAPQGV